jgi:hypothetical protein
MARILLNTECSETQVASQYIGEYALEGKKVRVVLKGNVPDLILGAEESYWLEACRRAAAAQA